MSRLLRRRRIKEDCGCYHFDEEDIKSAVEFYKKYKGNPELLKTEREKDFNEWVNHYDACPKISECYFDEWLFGYCFGDVIDDEAKS